MQVGTDKAMAAEKEAWRTKDKQVKKKIRRIIRTNLIERRWKLKQRQVKLTPEHFSRLPKRLLVNSEAPQPQSWT